MDTSQKRMVFIDLIPASFNSPTNVELFCCSIFRVGLRQKQGQNPIFTDPRIKLWQLAFAATRRRRSRRGAGDGDVPGHGPATLDFEFAEAHSSDDAPG